MATWARAVGRDHTTQRRHPHTLRNYVDVLQTGGLRRTVLSVILSVVTDTPPQMVTVDVAKMQRHVAEAEAEVARVRAQYEKLLAQANEELDEATDALAVATMSLKMVLDASVQANGDSSVGDEVAAAMPPGGTSELRNTPTKSAVLRHLEEHQDAAFSIDELVAAMERRGFVGSRNAVHVAISRIRKEGGPIGRVRAGEYKYDPRGAAGEAYPAGGSPDS